MMNGHWQTPIKNPLLCFMEMRKTLILCWKQTLQMIVTKQPGRLAIVGMGQELRGDDAVGVEIIRCLQRDNLSFRSVLLLDVGAAPENFTGSLRRFMPDVVIFIDAVVMNKVAGHVQFVDLQNTAGYIASTHTLSLRLLANYLQSELHCSVFLLGIQPLQTDLCNCVSPSVQQSLNSVVQILSDGLKRFKINPDL